MTEFKYATADVFTAAPLAGNPVAVVLDARSLDPAQMQALATEFNYVETTFVLPPADPQHTARIRIFTPDREVPFAGHPNLGTAFLLARDQIKLGEEAPQRFLFEEEAGLVAVELLYESGGLVGAELLSPEPLSRHSIVAVDCAAACLGLSAEEVRIDRHAPQIVSVGLPFLVMEVASREVLRRARPDRRAYDALLPLDGARAVYAYVPACADEQNCDFHARMFTWRLVEDPATGSATAALAAFLADIRGSDVSLRVWQGEDMQRPSLISTRSIWEANSIRARVAGRCVAVFRGAFDLP